MSKIKLLLVDLRVKTCISVLQGVIYAIYCTKYYLRFRIAFAKQVKIALSGLTESVMC